MRWIVVLALATGCDSLYSAGAGPVATIELVQGFADANDATLDTITLTLQNAAHAHDVVVVTLGWTDTSTTVETIVDSTHATFHILGAIDRRDALSQAVYYGVLPADAATETIDVMMSGPSMGLDIRALEYANVDGDHPVDIDAGKIGSGTTVDSGPLKTRHDGELLVACITSDTAVESPGAGFEQRVAVNGNIIEDGPAAKAGGYNATAMQASDLGWVIHTIAFRPAPL